MKICRPNPASSGVALILTLMMMSVLIMMVVTLAGVMRNEQASVRNLTYQVQAEQMADLGARQAMAMILSNTPVSTNNDVITATGPGWMLSNSSRRMLFPATTNQGVKNVEEIGTNSLILSLGSNSSGLIRGNLTAGWSNVVEPGAATPPVPMGRFTYWVDDEGTKVNLNATGSNNTNRYLPLWTSYFETNATVTNPAGSFSFPFSANFIFVTNNPASGTADTNGTAYADRTKAVAGRPNPFPTVESLKDPFVTGLRGTNSVGGTVYRRAKGHVTAWSSNADLTPWGSVKFSLNDLTNTNLYPTPDAAALAIKRVINTNGWTNVFGINMTLARKYGGGALVAGAAGNAGDVVLDQVAQNMLVAAGYAPTIKTNTANPGNLDAFRHRNGIPTAPVGLSQTPYLNEVAVSVSSLDTSLGGSPSITVTFYFQVEVVNPWRTNLAGYRLELQPRKLRFHIGHNRNPANIIPTVIPNYGTAWPDSMGASAGITGSAGCWAGPMMEDGNPWPVPPTANPLVANSLTFGANSFSVVPLIQTFICTFPAGLNPAPNNMRVDQAYVMIDRVVLRDGANNIVDWLTLDDFAQNANYGSTNTTRANDFGQLNFSPNYPFRGASYVTPLVAVDFSGGPFNNANSLGIAKNDPQVRFPVSAWNPTGLGQFKPAGGFPVTLQAWKRVAGGVAGIPAPTINTHNTVFDANNTTNPAAVTGFSYLRPDPVTNGTTVLTHPHFVPGYRVTNGFKSVAQLGAMHTGLPWRTLRLQPISAQERLAANGATNSPPDWILLDVFTATNATNLLPMVNLNGVPMALQGGDTNLAKNSDGSVPMRAWAVISAMGSAGSPIAASQSNLLASNGVPASLAQSGSGYTNLGAVASNLVAVLSNPVSPSGWSTLSDWRSARAVNPIFSTNTNALLLKGELLEIKGVAEDVNQGEDVIEGRLRSFLDLIGTRSDTFSVWSVGQGLLVLTNRTPFRTNVMAEVRKQTVFQRLPGTNNNGEWKTNPQGQVTNWIVRPVYTRNHVVE